MRVTTKYKSGIIALIFFLLISNFYGVSNLAKAAASGTVIASIPEDTLTPAGVSVSTLNSNGIGITAVDNTNGQWQYNNGELWYSIISPDAGKISFLGSGVQIRFVPKKDWNGTVQLTYRDSLNSESSATTVNLNAAYTGNEASYGSEGTAQIQVTPVNDAPYISEVGGSNYLGFDGKGYVTLPDLGIYSSSLTIEAWVNASAAPTWARIFDTSYGPDNFNLHLTFEGNTGRIALEALPQRGTRIKDYLVRTTETLPLNQWVHVAAVYNDAEKKAYIYWNGVLKGSGYMDLSNMANASAQNSNLSRPNNYIGESTWSQDANFIGGIRDFRIWNKAKTQSEIESQMNTSLTGSEANLKLSYRFDNPSDGTVAKDISTGGRNGTIISGQWLTGTGFNSNLITAVNTPATKSFKVNDADADALTVTAVSSNKSLVPDANISFSGSGSDRTIQMIPAAGVAGTSTITVTVNDGAASSTSSFVLSVVAGKYDLKFIAPSVGVMEPAFNRNIIYNKVHVPNKSGNNPNNSIDITVGAVNPADVNVTAYADNGSGLTISGAYPTFTVSGLSVGTYKLMKIKVADKSAPANYKEYQLDLIRYPGNNADLAAVNGLALSSSGQSVPLSPAYNSNTGNYTATVDSNVSSVKVDITKASLFSTASLNGTVIGSAESANASGNVSLKYGENLISVVVTAEDGKTIKTYSITVVRKMSADASLTSLTTEPAGLAPAFSVNQSEYTLKVGNAVTVADFTPTAAAGASLTINGISHPSGEPFSATGLIAGNNRYLIEVTAQDGVTRKVYKLVILRAPSDVADLSGLTVSAGDLSPAFDNNNTAYSVEVPNGVTAVDLTPKLLDNSASLTADGGVQADAAPYTKALNVGLNTVKFVVTSQSGLREKTTLVNIIRSASSNADLSGLDLSSGTLEPVFDKNQTAYTVTVANNVSEITLTPAAEDGKATLGLNGSPTGNAQPRTVKLQVGLNRFETLVTAEDGVTTKSYTVTVVRQASADADLANITLSGKSLAGGFDPSTSAYVEYVANNVTGVAVAATTSDPDATYTVNGLESAGGVPVKLEVGSNTVTLVSTAPDGVTAKEYTVTIIRAASSNVGLSDLTVNDMQGNSVPLSVSTDPNSYNGSVDDSVSGVMLNIITEDPAATTSVWINGTRVEDLNAVPLGTGLNVIEVYVTAQDGSMKVYKVNLVRNPSTDATLYDLTVSSGELTPGFQTDVEAYSVNVDNGVSSINVWVTANNWAAAYTLKKNGSDAGVAGDTVSLDEGANRITVEVTAADGVTTKAYTVTVNRAVLPKDSSLAALEIHSARGTETPTPAFAADTFTYSLGVPYEIRQLELEMTQGDPAAQIRINGIDADNPALVVLKEGLNIVNVKVTARDGKTESVYQFEITRGSRSPDANLAGISVDAGELEPVFNPDVLNYTVEVESDVTSVALIPSAADPKADIRINGRDGASLTALVEGDNIFDVTVTAEDGTQKTYTVNIVKAPQPSPTPSEEASPTPTPSEESTATPTPSEEPTPTPSAETSAEPSQAPSAEASAEPEPTPTPSAETSAEPSPEASAEPSAAASAEPSPVASAEPSPVASAESPAPATAAPAPVVSTASAVPSPVTEEIKVKVESGQVGQGSILTETVIQRTKDSGGNVHDVVTLPLQQAQDVVKNIVSSGETTARILIPDPEDRVSDVNVNIPKEAVKLLGDSNVNLEIYTENVRISIPQSSLDSFTEDLYFHVVPIKDEAHRKEVEDRARIERIVREVAGNQQIDVVARPMTIETNMQSRPVTLTLPLRDVQLPSDSKEREAFLANLVIFVEHSDGDKELVKAKVANYESGKLGLEFGINKFSTFTILNMEGWEKYLAQLEQQEIHSHSAYINGYQDGTFRPDHSITRAEMAAILARNLGYDDSSQAPVSAYPDVKDGHWAAGAIGFMKEAGLMLGDERGQFRPDAPISRAEMAAIAARYKKLDTSAKASYRFSDISGHWAAGAIEAASEADILNGYEDGAYRPARSLTRAEAVKVVNKMFGRGPVYGVETPSWPDVPATHWAFAEIEEASINHSYMVRAEGGETVKQ